MKKLTLFSLLALTAACFQVGAQQAQYPPPYQQADQQDDGDAPDHGVARISLASGDVSVGRGDSGDMVAAATNAPLVTGDRILTGERARAEVQFDGENLIRLAPGTEVRMGDLQYRHYLVQIAQGTTTFRVLRDPGPQEQVSDVEISTPSVSLRPLRRGVYRVTVRPDGSSELTVREGEAELFAPTGSETLRPGQTIISRGNPSDPEFMDAPTLPFDEWDRWNSDRDQAFERYNDTSRYVSPDIYGTEELGPYGRWQNDPSEGSVWVPNVDADWAPYRNGRWSWVDYYGWSWVSYDPWGWAPYHYGRWNRGAFGWGWYPGSVASRQYWRPALVGFFGWGSPGFGTSLGFGFGNVGWVPLAPHERFHPWYGRGFAAARGPVVANGNIFSTYRNARYAGAVTSVGAGEFGRGSTRSGGGYVRASQADLSRAGMINGAVPFRPSHEARILGNRDFNPRGMPNTQANMRFYSSQSQRGTRATSGSDQTSRGQSRGFANSPGTSQPNGPQSFSRGFERSQGGGFTSGAGGGGLTSGGGTTSGGWRRFDAGSQPAPSSSANPGGPQGGRFGYSGQSNQSAPQNQNSFRRFGDNPRGGDTQNAPSGPQSVGSRQDGYRGFDRTNPGNPGINDRQRGNTGRGFDGFRQPQANPPSQEFSVRQGRDPQPVRIAPPIVNSRGADRGNGPGGDFRFGGPRGESGAHFNAPQSNAQSNQLQNNAPQNNQRQGGFSAPRGNPSGGGSSAPRGNAGGRGYGGGGSSGGGGQHGGGENRGRR